MLICLEIALLVKGGYIRSRSFAPPSYLLVHSIVDNYYFFDVSDAHMFGNGFVGNTHFRCSVLRSDACKVVHGSSPRLPLATLPALRIPGFFSSLFLLFDLVLCRIKPWFSPALINLPQQIL